MLSCIDNWPLYVILVRGIVNITYKEIDHVEYADTEDKLVLSRSGRH